MSDEKQETIADIVKDLRRQSDSESAFATELRRTDDDVDFASAACYAEDAKYLSRIADRIEAAWKREILELKRKYGDEEVYCAHCGEKLEKIMLHKFGFNGDEYDDDFPCEFSATIMEDGSIGILICTDRNWCGYDLTEDEQREDISCPKCGKFPFSDIHIEVAEPDNVYVSCWTKKGVADGIR